MTIPKNGEMTKHHRLRKPQPAHPQTSRGVRTRVIEALLESWCEGRRLPLPLRREVARTRPLQPRPRESHALGLCAAGAERSALHPAHAPACIAAAGRADAQGRRRADRRRSQRRREAGEYSCCSPPVRSWMPWWPRSASIPACGVSATASWMACCPRRASSWTASRTGSTGARSIRRGRRRRGLQTHARWAWRRC